MPDKKSKKSLKPSQHLFLGIPTNIAAGPLGFRAELSIGPKGEKNPRTSRVVFHEERSECPPPETSATDAVVSGTEDRNGPAEVDNGDTRNEEGEPAEVLRVPDRETALRTATSPAYVTKESTDILKEPVGGFGPLKTVLEAVSTVYVNHEETVAVEDKIEDLLSRITALEAPFATPPSDVAEQRRWADLIRKSKEIEGQLRFLYEKPESPRLNDNGRDDEDVFMLLEDLREAISNYQVAQQAMMYDQECNLVNPADAAVLDNIRCAQDAEYRHGDRRGCLKGTRRAILDKIAYWARDFNRPPVYWLNGLAGTGKSTVAQTIAERIFSDGQLGASFFCSRDFEDRSDLRLVFPTLAVQLARRYAEFRSILVPLVRSDPTSDRGSLFGQMEKLIVGPLVKSGISTVIIIDALDECKDEEPASAILSVLGQFMSRIPNVKFFVTGRPEPRIREGFRLPLLAKVTDVFVLHEVESSRVNGDIRLFFQHQLSELKGRRRGLDGWPMEEHLDLLCERAGGLFVYAVATAKFIDKQNSNPRKRLNLLLQSPGNTVHEGKIKLKANATLDSLYMSILRGAFEDDDPEDDPKIRSVLGAVTLAANPLSPSTIATLLGFDTEDVFPLLSAVHSLLIFKEDVDHPVQPFHKSFPDFIIDPVRCTDRRFLVSPPDHHAKLLAGCLELMNKKLKQNMCKLPDGVVNSEVDDLKERIEQCIDHGLRYACRSWHKHLVGTLPEHTLKITPILHRFLEGKFLFWLEVLSVLGVAREAVDALEAAAKWLDASPTLDLVNDYFRFVTGFFKAINTSAPNIYHSALLLSPQTSIIRKLYKSYVRPLAKVVRGLPTSWEPVVATVYHGALVVTAAWSPCGKFIAIAWFTSMTVEILDAVTLERLDTFDAPKDRIEWLSFSPNSRLLTRFNSERVLSSWDLQTGGPVGAIPSEPDVSPGQCFSSTYSTDGKAVAVAYKDLVNPTATTLSTYDLLSRTQMYSHHVSEGSIVAPIWTHGECLRFVTVSPGSITIWGVGFTSMDALAEVESLPAPDDISCSEESLFLPTLSRLAFTLRGEVVIWDAQDSKYLLNFTGGNQSTRMSFSPDGRFFACGTIGLGVHLWKESPTGYVLHQQVASSIRGVIRPLLSPGGESVIVLSHKTIQLWRTAEPILESLPGAPTRSVDRTNFILGFSPDQTLAAVARLRENSVTLLDLKSGDSRLTVDTGMEILGLRVTESTVCVVGEGKVVTWDIPTEDRALGARANINDSARTTMFNYSPHPHPPLVPYISISPDSNRIASVWDKTGGSESLNIYDVSTGKRLTGTTTTNQGFMPWFTPDGREVWCTEGHSVEGWTITEDGESGLTKLEPLGPTAQPSGGFPWKSSRDYKITDSGWVLNSSGKRLLWLPNNWRSDETYRMWSGRVLGLLHRGLPEAVILELDE